MAACLIIFGYFVSLRCLDALKPKLSNKADLECTTYQVEVTQPIVQRQRLRGAGSATDRRREQARRKSTCSKVVETFKGGTETPLQKKRIYRSSSDSAPTHLEYCHSGLGRAPLQCVSRGPNACARAIVTSRPPPPVRVTLSHPWPTPPRPRSRSTSRSPWSPPPGFPAPHALSLSEPRASASRPR